MSKRSRRARAQRKEVKVESNRSYERLNLVLEKMALSFGGGILLALPFVAPSLSWIHFVALVPWTILAVYPRYQAHSAWVLPGAYIYLMMSMRPFTLFHFLAPLTLALICFGPFAFFPFFLKKLYRRTGLPLALLVPLVWAPMEWLRVRLNFNQLQLYYLGSSQYDWTHLIQVADFAGVYGVSFIVACASGLITDFVMPAHSNLDRRRRWVQSVAFALVVFGGALLYGLFRIEDATIRSGPRIAIIQPNKQHYRDPKLNEELFAYQLGFTRSEIEAGATDLIAWPENAVYDRLNRRSDYIGQLTDLAREKRADVLVGAFAEVPEGLYTSAYLFSGQGIRDRYDKVQMIFWSEYMPLDDLLARYWPALRRLHRRYARFVLGYVGVGRQAKEIKVLTLPTPSGNYRFTVPICFEASGSNFGRRSARQGADFLINITSEGVLGPAMYTHMWALNTFRAVENRVSVVRAGNNGISGFIDPNGRVQSLLRGKKTGALYLEEGTLIDRVKLDSRRAATFYSRFGDAFVFACALAIGALLLFEPMARRVPASKLATERAA